MMREIIEKDNEREKFLRELLTKLELLQRENQILTTENKSLKEMMTIWNIRS
jgi:cell shape-determining protein MreC